MEHLNRCLMPLDGSTRRDDLFCFVYEPRKNDTRVTLAGTGKKDRAGLLVLE